jgi:hypothetical protein
LSGVTADNAPPGVVDQFCPVSVIRPEQVLSTDLIHQTVASNHSLLRHHRTAISGTYPETEPIWSCGWSKVTNSPADGSGPVGGSWIFICATSISPGAAPAYGTVPGTGVPVIVAREKLTGSCSRCDISLATWPSARGLCLALGICHVITSPHIP